MSKSITYILLFFAVFFSVVDNSYAWENKKTHPAITDKAIAACEIDNYLKTQLQ